MRELLICYSSSITLPTYLTTTSNTHRSPFRDPTVNSRLSSETSITGRILAGVKVPTVGKRQAYLLASRASFDHLQSQGGKAPLEPLNCLSSPRRCIATYYIVRKLQLYSIVRRTPQLCCSPHSTANLIRWPPFTSGSQILVTDLYNLPKAFLFARPNFHAF